MAQEEERRIIKTDLIATCQVCGEDKFWACFGEDKKFYLVCCECEKAHHISAPSREEIEMGEAESIQ